jgi:YfiH family protein
MSTMGGGDFVRQERGGVVIHVCRALADIPGLRHGFSTRHGGVSPLPRDALNLSRVAWDAGENVEENRRRFLSALGIDPSELRALAQMHSDRIHVVETGEPWARVEGDAMITALPRLALAIQVADCFPVVLADPDRGVIANLHAGWRGTAARIAEKAVRLAVSRFGSDPGAARVAIGPGIRSCCFEVEADVAAVFEASFPGMPLARPRPGVPGKFLVDLPAALGHQLRAAGVGADNIHDLGACTRCNPDEFFSYRGEGPRSGRLMAVIARS